MNYRHLIYLFLISLLLISCSGENRQQGKASGSEMVKKTRLDEIRERGSLIALTNYNSMSYFIYRGEPMGYEFEKLKMLADHLGVHLEIRINNDIEKSFETLENGECDLIAMSLTVTNDRSKRVDFTLPHAQTTQVLVQRMPENWRKMKTYDEIESHLIRNPLDLKDKTVYVQKASTFYNRMIHLSDEIGGTIIIVEVEDKDSEQLIAAVAHGEIDYTISDENMALVNEKYFPNIDIKTEVSFEQNLAWAVRKGSDSLVAAINEWLEDFNHSVTSRFIYNKYFKNPRSVHYARSEFHSLVGGKISEYDDVIRQISEKYGMDWRLLASIIYQESQFRPDVKSWVGAWGLMQLMPATAEVYGIDTNSSAEAQIEAGVMFMKSLDNQFPEEISDADERMKFILAAYNVGIAHVYDARRLAEKNGKDPNVWTGNVDFYLLNKSNPKYYQDSVVRYGYARGEEPYNFVIEILDRYEHYKNVIEN